MRPNNIALFNINRRPPSAGAVEAYQQILDQAAADGGWEFIYDYTNPNALTLDGSNNVSDLTDGLAQRPKLRNTTAAERPAISVGQFGALDAAYYNQKRLYTPDAEWAAFAGPATYFMLIQHVVVLSTDNRAWNLHNTTRHEDRIAGAQDGGIQKFVARGTTSITGGGVTTNPILEIIYYDGVNSKITGNDVELVAGDTGTLNHSGNSVGFRASSTTYVDAHIGIKMCRRDRLVTPIANMKDLIHDLTGIAKGSI